MSGLVARLINSIFEKPRTWLMIATTGFAFFGFAFVASEVFDDDIGSDNEAHAFDDKVFAMISQFRSASMTQMMTDLTALGSVSVLTLISVLTIAILWTLQDRLGVLHFGVALLGAAVWPRILKPLFGRERPDISDRLVEVGELSFPSGHSFGAAVAYTTFAFFGARYLQKLEHELLCYSLAFLVMVLIGLTRVYLGVHYFSDVAAGLCAGVAWAFLVASFFVNSYPKSSPPH